MRTLTLAIVAMLIGGNAMAGDVIAPPISKYVVDVPTPPKRPTNFGKVDPIRIAQKVQEVTKK